MIKKLIQAITLDATLDVAGLGFLAVAAWTWNITAGLAATGVALLLLGWRSQ